jgi:hypothetical protein
MSVAQRQFWESVPADQRPTVEAAVFAAVDSCRTDDGRVGFDQQVRSTLGRRAK